MEIRFIEAFKEWKKGENDLSSSSYKLFTYAVIRSFVSQKFSTQKWNYVWKGLAWSFSIKDEQKQERNTNSKLLSWLS